MQSAFNKCAVQTTYSSTPRTRRNEPISRVPRSAQATRSLLWKAEQRRAGAALHTACLVGDTRGPTMTTAAMLRLMADLKYIKNEPPEVCSTTRTRVQQEQAPGGARKAGRPSLGVAHRLPQHPSLRP